MDRPLSTREAYMSAQIAEAEQHLFAAAEQLTAAAMSITGVLIEGECSESDKLQALAGAIATHKRLISGLTELLRQVPRPHLQNCSQTRCAREACPYDPAQGPAN